MIVLLIAAGYAALSAGALIVAAAAVLAAGALTRRFGGDPRIEALIDATREPRWTAAEWQEREKELLTPPSKESTS